MIEGSQLVSNYHALRVAILPHSVTLFYLLALASDFLSDAP
jgi:hypothetical protein